MNKILGLMIAVVLAVGCNTTAPTADKMQTQQQEKMLSEAQREIGMPNIVNFQEKKLLKLIYELRDKEDLICYAYIKSDYQGKLFFIGRCIGYGMPCSAQITNPSKVENDPNGGYEVGSVVIPQAEPNGLFMPESAMATWLMMLDPKTNKPHPVYFEPEVVVSPFPLI